MNTNICFFFNHIKCKQKIIAKKNYDTEVWMAEQQQLIKIDAMQANFLFIIVNLLWETVFNRNKGHKNAIQAY